jgi:hypothetical protein
VIVRSSLISTFKRCNALAYYQYALGLVTDTEEKNIDLSFGTLIHDAVDILHKTGDVQDALTLIENTTLPTNHKRKNNAIAKALIREYVKKYPNVKLLESETATLAGQDLAFRVGRHLWKLRMDTVVNYQNRKWVGENKTSRRDYLLVRPNDQFISYYIAAKNVDPEMSGVMVTVFDSEVVNVDSIFFTPSTGECAEWKEEMEFTIDHLERCAFEGIFPTNPYACFQFGPSKACYCLPLCQARSKADREKFIQKYYKINDEAVNLSW